MPATRKKAASPKKRSRAAPYFQSVAIVVGDRAKARAWYTGSLGLEVLDDEGHWLTVGRKGQGSRLHLCQTNEFEPGAQLEPGNTGILLLVPGDFEEECAHLKEAGVEFKEGPTKADWGWYAIVRDPDGNELSLGPSS